MLVGIRGDVRGGHFHLTLSVTFHSDADVVTTINRPQKIR